MRQSSVLSLGLLLLGASELVNSKALPNPQPDPKPTSAPQSITPAVNFNERSLLKRQQSPEEVCGLNYALCDLSFCCPANTYCYPEFDSSFTNYVWRCNDLSTLDLDFDLSSYEESIKDILASITGGDFSYIDFPNIFPSSGNLGSDSKGLDSNSKNESGGGGGLSTGAIIGIVVTVVLIVAIVVFAVFFIKKRRQKRVDSALTTSHITGYPPPPPPQMAQQHQPPENPPNYMAVARPGEAPVSFYDPSKQPFLQNQQPDPQYGQSPHASPQPQPQHYPVSQGQYPPTPQPQPQPQYSYPEGIAEAAGSETRVVSPSPSTKKPSAPITPIPSLVPTSGPPTQQPPQQQDPQQFIYEIDSSSAKR